MLQFSRAVFARLTAAWIMRRFRCFIIGEKEGWNDGDFQCKGNL